MTDTTAIERVFDVVERDALVDSIGFAQALAQLDALKADSERLEWLLTNPDIEFVTIDGIVELDTRAAIDAAMEATDGQDSA